MDINRQEAGAGVGQQFPRHAFDAEPRERRREQRTTLTEVVYLKIGPENGGVVTDVSSSGIGVRTDLPMDAAGAVSFALLINGSILSGSADVIWIDKTRMSCGLRFTSITPSLRFQINRWIGGGQSGLPHDAGPRSGAAPEMPFADAPQTREAESQFPNQPARDTFMIDDWEKQEREASAMRSRAFVRGLATGLVLAAAIAGVLVYLGLANFGRIPTLAKAPVASLPPASVPSSSVPSASPLTPSVGVPTPPVPQARATPTPATPGPATAPALSADSSPREQDSGAVAQSAPTNRQSPDALEPRSSRGPVAATDESALDEADAYLRSGRSREAAPLLWRALSTGNTTAETKLADLYLRGDGVAKSCAQGRVLLSAAAKAGNADAQHRLSSLLRTGCR